jgi:predicted methyltransferase
MIRPSLAGCALDLALILALAVPASAAPRPLGPAGAPASAFPAPDRPVADVVSPIWDSERARDRTREVETVARHLGLGPGSTVADIGAGSGYYAVRLARLVGAEGRVYAQDIVPNYLSDLERRVRREGLRNVTVSLGEPHDPRLPAGSLDAAVLVHMYHEIGQPYGLLANLIPSLKPGGRGGLVDVDAPTGRHGTPPTLLACELAAVGYREVGRHDLGRSGYMAIFEPPAARPDPGRIVPCREARAN